MPSDATTIANAVNLFTAALILVLNPATKTKGTVEDKNAKKAPMLVTVRQYARVIKNNLGVSNEAKIALGLHINSTTHTPVPAPGTAPAIRVFGSETPLQQILRFNDVTTPDRRAKPPGVKGMMVALIVGTTPPADATGLPIIGMATKQPYAVTFTAADKGKNAYYFGRWITASGLVGPWSAMAQLVIGG
jgi:hypothetical protein